MNARVRALALTLTLSFGLPLVSSTPREALAQDDATTQEARKRFVEGVKLFDEKKYEQARASFLQAYALKKHPDVLLNLAQAELLSNHPMEAAQHFKEFLRDTANEKHPKRPEAAKGLEESRMRLGRIQITVDQPDAEVFLDGKKVGMSPLAEAFEVTPGQHAVEAKKGGKSAAQNVSAPEAKITIVSLSIGGTSPPPVVTAPPPATTEPPPATSTTAPPAPTSRPDEGPRPDNTASLSTDNLSGGREPFMRWAARSPVAYTGAGLTLVGLGLGIGFAIAANNAQNNADSLTSKIKTTAAKDESLLAQGRSTNPCASPIPTGNAGDYSKACSNLRTNIDAADTNRKVMTTGIVVGVIGIGTIVGGYFLTAKRTDTGALQPPRFMLAPTFGPDGAGLGAVGQF